MERPEVTCHRCGQASVVLFRDYRDLGFCFGCIFRGLSEAERRAFMERWRALTRKDPSWDSTPFVGGS